jgi:hypothetical protein
MFDEFSEDLVSSISSMPGLRALDLHGLDLQGPLWLDAAASGIANLTQLTRLRFEWVSCYGPDSALSMLSVLASLTGLQHLELSHCVCTNEHVVAVAANLTNLTHLTLGLLPEEDDYTPVDLDPAALCMLTLLTGLQELVFERMPIANNLVQHFSTVKRVRTIV